MRSLLDDLRNAVRALAKRPRFLLAVVVPLALGMGANVAIFAIVDAVLFRQLPVREPEGLLRVFTVDRGRPEETIGTSYPLYADYRDRATAFSGLAGYSDPAGVHVTVDRRMPERVNCMLVTGNYFEVLGVPTPVGRGLAPADDAAGAANVAVISDRYWRTLFDGDPGAVGAVIRVGGTPFTVVGVAGAEFTGIDLDTPAGRPDLWFPVNAVATVTPEVADLKPLTAEGFGWLNVVGRIAPGTARAQADAQLAAIADERIARYCIEEFKKAEGVDLSGMNLQHAILNRARITNVNLRGANLQHASLYEAKLYGTNLQGANLQFARLEGAKFDENTILPDGNKWTPGMNMARFTDPRHPDFWSAT